MKALIWLLLAGCGSTPYNPSYHPPERQADGCRAGTIQVCKVHVGHRICGCTRMQDIFR